MAWLLVTAVEGEEERVSERPSLGAAKERLYMVAAYLRVMGSEAVIHIERDGEVAMTAAVVGGEVSLTWLDGPTSVDEVLMAEYGMEGCGCSS